MQTSIGPIGFASPSASGRIKGIIPGIASTNEDIEARLCEVRKGALQLTISPESRKPMFRDKSRLTVRIIMNQGLSKHLRKRLAEKAHEGIEIEAELPFKEKGTAKLALVYLSYNDPTRRLNPHQHADLYRKAVGYYKEASSTHASIRVILSEVRRKGYDFATFNGPECAEVLGKMKIQAEALPALLSEVYQEYDITSAFRVVTAPGNTITIAVKNGEVVSMSILERASIPYNGGEIKIAEVTDGMVRPGHNGNNLYLATTSRLIASIDPSENSIIFGEATFTHEAVPRAFAALGADFRGILQRHLHIKGRLTDFAVMQFERERISELALAIRN